VVHGLDHVRRFGEGVELGVDVVVREEIDAVDAPVTSGVVGDDFLELQRIHGQAQTEPCNPPLVSSYTVVFYSIRHTDLGVTSTPNLTFRHQRRTTVTAENFRRFRNTFAVLGAWRAWRDGCFHSADGVGRGTAGFGAREAQDVQEYAARRVLSAV
jgi:hypothetical protein